MTTRLSRGASRRVARPGFRSGAEATGLAARAGLARMGGDDALGSRGLAGSGRSAALCSASVMRWRVSEAGCRQRILEEGGNPAGPEVAHVGSPIPADTRALPVFPQSMRMFRKRETITVACEYEAAIPWHLRCEAHGRHRREDLFNRPADDVVLNRSSSYVCGAAHGTGLGGPPSGCRPRPRRARSRCPRGAPRRRRRARRRQSDRGRSLSSNPRQQAPDVPDRLREPVHGVHEVEREERLAADPGHLAGSMQWVARAMRR